MILIVNMNSKELAVCEFVAPIKDIAGQYEDCDVRHYSEIPKDLSKYSRIILSGTTLKEDKYLEDIDMFSWLRDFSKPVLGICAGMQVISLVFGSKLRKCKEVGMVNVKTVKKNSLFSGRFDAYALHNYAIRPSRDLEVLAESKDCVQAVRVKNIYGVLFHPEVRNKDVVKNFVLEKF